MSTHNIFPPPTTVGGEFGEERRVQVLYRCSVLRCVVVCCSLVRRGVLCAGTSQLQCVAACCSVLQCVVVWCNSVWRRAPCSGTSYLQYVAMCCSVLHCAAVCCTVLQFIAMCCSVLHCVAICCSLFRLGVQFSEAWCMQVTTHVAVQLQSAAVCCNVFGLLIYYICSKEPYIYSKEPYTCMISRFEIFWARSALRRWII